MNDYQIHNPEHSELYTQHEEPQNYMTLAIISTILGCCSFMCIGFITGLIAIYFSSQVKPKYRENDFEAAARNSKNAKILSFVSIGLFFVGMIYTLIMYLTNPELFMEQIEEMQRAIEKASNN